MWPLIARGLGLGISGLGGFMGAKYGLSPYVNDIGDWRHEVMGGDELWDLEEKYGPSPEGLSSQARHASASSQLSDYFADKLSFSDRPSKFSQFMGDVGSFGAGAITELPAIGRAIKNPSSWRDHWRSSKEDIISDWQGSFGTEYGKPMKHIYHETFNQGVGTPNFRAPLHGDDYSSGRFMHGQPPSQGWSDQPRNNTINNTINNTRQEGPPLDRFYKGGIASLWRR